ncbi:MAG: hypothetical protein LBR95_08770 [Azoarcus sp.]|jgi:hypothetical protein|nr:hypothetical protein [Azoarcus sp.]
MMGFFSSLEVYSGIAGGRSNIGARCLNAALETFIRGKEESQNPLI